MRASLSLRPLPWLAAVISVDTLGGILAARGDPALALGAALLHLAALCWRTPGAAMLALLGLLSFARGWCASPPTPAVPADRAALAAARDAPIVGRWRSEGRAGAGFVEPAGVPAAAGHRILLESDAPVPRDGDWVAVLAGREATPWAAGPEPGPRARDGRFAGSSIVRPDELVRRSDRTRFAAAFRARAERWIEGLRDAIRTRTAALESAGRAHGLVRSLVLGERDELAADVRDLFTRTGTAHLLAVSGFNVSLLFGVVALLALLPLPGRGSRRARALGAWSSAALLFTYAWVVGGSAPVLRASTSLALGAFAPPADARGAWLPRRADPLSLWSAALLLECCLDPRDLAQVSLQLSYLATLGILLATRPLQRLLDLERWLGEPAPGRAPLRLAVGILARRGLRLASLSLSASAAAVLFTLPVVWQRFGETCPAGVLVTPLVAPVLGAALVLAWIGVLVPAGGLALVVGWLGERSCDLLVLADALPGTPAPLPPRPVALVALAVLLLALALVRAELRGSAGRAAALVGGLLLLPWCLASERLELHALDAGHGSSFVLRAPGLSALVFDAGSRDRRELYEEALAPLLARWEVARPWVGLSHEDTDHLSALPKLVERYPPAVWLGALPASLAERLPGDARILDASLGTTELGAPEPHGPLRLRIQRPDEQPGNEGSRSLEIGWGAERLLLCGDAEERGLERALRAGWLAGPVRLLTLPHHGSESPWLGDLLDRTAPSEVWISNGAPAPAESELARRRIPFSRTGASGPLALFLPWPRPVLDPELAPRNAALRPR